MSDELIPISRYLACSSQHTLPIACHDGHYFSFGQYVASVNYWVDWLQQQPFQSYALYTRDAYPFAVLLMALVHAGKEVWIPGNNRPGTAEQLRQFGCQLIGDWQASEPLDYHLEGPGDFGKPFLAVASDETRLVMFTSGSSGNPKPVEKRLRQLDTEIAALEKQWGHILSGAKALSTVSHQHIYGLLFRVLWPLSAGRCFHSELFLNPEMMIADARHSAAYWVASPAQLKRMDQDSPWQGIAGLKALFSSGGPLPSDVARHIWSSSEQAVIEIFGSTETGGIAWRQYNRFEQATWKLFDGLTLTERNGRSLLHSPYLPDQSGLYLDDRIDLQEDGSFLLLGRHDRIVKVEEKRVSLTELENRLQESPWVESAHAIKLSRHRDIVGAVVVLSKAGAELLTAQGRRTVINRLRSVLANWFEAVTLPRKWLFSNAMPKTAQDKIDQMLMMELLNSDNRKWPSIRAVTIDSDRVLMRIKVPECLIHFPDHFNGFPVLPGVVQIAWAEHYGKLFFSIAQPFLHMEVIKFTKLIQPGDELAIRLEWKPASGKLYFTFSSVSGVYSSGRMVYGARS